MESFPHRNFGRDEFEWYRETTTADATYREILLKPDKAVEFILKGMFMFLSMLM